MMPGKDSVLKFRCTECRCCWVTSHEHNLLLFSTPQSYAVLSAESKTTQAADYKEMLDECHDIVWCHTIFLYKKNSRAARSIYGENTRNSGANQTATKNAFGAALQKMPFGRVNGDK